MQTLGLLDFRVDSPYEFLFKNGNFVNSENIIPFIKNCFENKSTNLQELYFAKLILYLKESKIRELELDSELKIYKVCRN